MNTSCIICSSSNLQILRAFKGSNKIFHQKYLKQCSDCQMVFIDPMPSDEELDNYNASYFESAHGGHPSHPIAVAFFSGIGKLRGTYIESFLNRHQIKVDKVLEIGPGHGDFANNWKKNHPTVQYFGVETDTSCHAILEQAGIQLLSLSQVETSLEEVDLVVISHVLEHVSNPQTFLEKVTNKLRKGGVLFVEVPCMDWKHKDSDEPHLLFFDKEPMAYLLSHLGFEGVELNYFGKSIERLKRPTFFYKLGRRIRSKLIDLGYFYLFSFPFPHSLAMLTALERTATRNFKAHKESEKPAWWLRAISIKN
jgi:2-polyprenyl-3-methyl-5-hydroxy-6-metoxy-1,4-benzoquinol methylase